MGLGDEFECADARAWRKNQKAIYACNRKARNEIRVGIRECRLRNGDRSRRKFVGLGGDNRAGSMGTESSYIIYEPAQFQKGTTFLSVSVNRGGNIITPKGGNYRIAIDGTYYVTGGWNEVIAGSAGLKLENRTLSCISSGYTHALALDSNGGLCAWGVSSHGQLGFGVKGEIFTNFKLGDYIFGCAKDVMPEKIFVYAEAVYDSSFAIDEEGKLWVWGANKYGGVNGESGRSNTPKKITLQ